MIYDWRRRSASHCEAGNLLAAQLWRKEPAEERTHAQVRRVVAWPLLSFPCFPDKVGRGRPLLGVGRWS